MSEPLHDHPNSRRTSLVRSMSDHSRARDREVRVPPPLRPAVSARVTLDRDEASVEQTVSGLVTITNRGADPVLVSEIFVHTAPAASSTGWSAGHGKPVLVAVGTSVQLPISVLSHQPRVGLGLRHVVGASVRLADGSLISAENAAVIIHPPY